MKTHMWIHLELRSLPSEQTCRAPWADLGAAFSFTREIGVVVRVGVQRVSLEYVLISLLLLIAATRRACIKSE